MSIQPIDSGKVFYDSSLNAVLQANGTLTSYNSHEMTMLWPSYTQFNIDNSAIKRLIPATYDHWANTVEYYDHQVCMMAKLDLKTGLTKNFPLGNSQSQKNFGWNVEEKKPKKIRFATGTVLFHKTSRTKWVFDKIDSVTNHLVLRSFYDKSQAMQIFEKDYEEFEEIFF
jgi:hypothetical protein